jgi:hypothetical protein
MCKRARVIARAFVVVLLVAWCAAGNSAQRGVSSAHSSAAGSGAHPTVGVPAGRTVTPSAGTYTGGTRATYLIHPAISYGGPRSASGMALRAGAGIQLAGHSGFLRAAGTEPVGLGIFASRRSRRQLNRFGFFSGPVFFDPFFFGGFGFSANECLPFGLSTLCFFGPPFQPMFFPPGGFSGLCSPFAFCPNGFYSLGINPIGVTSGETPEMLSPGEIVAGPADLGPPVYAPSAPQGSGEGQAQDQAQQNAGQTAILFFADGTNFQVSDYWLDGGRLHYATAYRRDMNVAIEQLDLQRTVDENWKRGLAFALRPKE